MFHATIMKETGKENLPSDIQFCQATIWDAAHLLKRVTANLCDGKLGSSGHFWTSFIKQAHEFNHLLSSGNGYAQLEASPLKKILKTQKQEQLWCTTGEKGMLENL
eukprot:gene4289-4858_t